MATHGNRGVNKTPQASFAELAGAFHNADDALIAATERGIIDRTAEIDTRADALVAMLSGPAPTTPSEAHSAIFAAMQAVVEGNDFDPAWRATVSRALVLLGTRLAPRAPRNVVFGSVEPFDPESYHGIRDDLDTLMGDLESAVGLVCFLVMRETESTEGSPMALSPDFVGALFSVQNLLEGFKRQGDALVHRMMDLERIAEAQP